MLLGLIFQSPELKCHAVNSSETFGQGLMLTGPHADCMHMPSVVAETSLYTNPRSVSPLERDRMMKYERADGTSEVGDLQAVVRA